MKTLKEGLFWFVMFYVVIISFLFIRQAFIVHKTMYKEIDLEPNEKYETFITESRAKLANYRSLATTQEEINCLNEVEKAINNSYNLQHAPITNYKEAKEYYYKMFSNGVGNFYNWGAVNEVCKLHTLNGYDSSEITKYILANVAHIESKFVESNYVYQISLPSLIVKILKGITDPTFDVMLIRAGQDTSNLVINNDINYIDSILKLVGEKYE